MRHRLRRLCRPAGRRRRTGQLLSPQSAAQLTVFDPVNYQENLLSAARALEQINNQVRQLQNQAQMHRCAWIRTCVRLGVNDLTGSAAHARRHPSASCSAGDGIALRSAGDRRAGYEQLFPRQASASPLRR